MLRVRTTFTNLSVGPAVNTLFFAGSDGAAATAAANAVATFWRALNGSIATGGSMHVETDVDLVSEATGQVTGSFFTSGDTFTFAGGAEPLPWANQGLIRLNTGVWVAGRQVVGRIFVPGPVEAVNTLGAPSASYISSLTTAISTLLSTSQVGVYSRTGHAFHEATGATVPAKWAILRSRRD